MHAVSTRARSKMEYCFSSVIQEYHISKTIFSVDRWMFLSYKRQNSTAESLYFHEKLLRCNLAILPRGYTVEVKHFCTFCTRLSFYYPPPLYKFWIDLCNTHMVIVRLTPLWWWGCWERQACKEICDCCHHQQQQAALPTNHTCSHCRPPNMISWK